MLLGCIGDDFTGSSDLANTLAKGGMRVTQYSGVPATPADTAVEAGIVALKSRTVAPGEAVALSLAAADWLLDQGCRQLVFKYCSTFDSTPQGNIGPVIDALMQRIGVDRTIVCPAFPAAGRSVYGGHLFVGDRLLNESGMENHPLTPMRDPDIRRWLAQQTLHGVGHVPALTVFGGPEAIAAAIDGEKIAGRPVVVVDAIRDEDLLAIGVAARTMGLVTGGSGIALGLPENFRAQGLLGSARSPWRGSEGPAVILSGSCSSMTRLQVRRYAEHHPAMQIAPDALMDGGIAAPAVADWVLANAAKTVPLVYSSDEPAAVKVAQERFGRAAVAERVEAFFAELARLLVAGGISRIVVAGGETSGAVVEGLALPAFDIGPEIAPGVPAVKASDRPLWLSLKSGNFGDVDFFEKALAVLKESGK